MEPSTTRDIWMIIINPVASNGKALQRWNALSGLLKAENFSFQIKMTEYARHATSLAKAAIEEGFRKIITVGGDGTNNEVINGIFKQNTISPKEITYALFPCGTGNDWSRTHQIPKNPRKWIAFLKRAKTLKQDIGRVIFHDNGESKTHYFTNVAGMAYDAFVVQNSKGTETGGLGYLWITLKSLFKYQLEKAKVHIDGKELEDFFYTINVGICPYSGGGMRLVPHAIPDDGKLALTIVTRVSKLKVILNTYRFYTGTIAEMKEVDTYQAENIQVESASSKPILLEVDGEFLGETPVHFFIEKNALNIIVGN